MPSVPTGGLDPQLFASLIARFDTGNNEAEAMNAARAMRRMVSKEGLRIVDVLERADVRKALDDQLQPVREDSAELKEAFDKIRQLADLLAQERQKPQRRQTRTESGPINGGLVALVTLAVIVLLAFAEFQ
jgi:hypothetical protein